MSVSVPAWLPMKRTSRHTNYMYMCTQLLVTKSVHMCICKVASCHRMVSVRYRMVWHAVCKLVGIVIVYVYM